MIDEKEGGDEALTYSVAEARKRLPLGINQFYQGVKKGEIPSIKVGGKILIPKKAFDAKFSGEAA